MKKILIWILITVLATLIVAGFLWFQRQQQAAMQTQEVLRTAEAFYGDLEITTATSGKVIVNQSTDLRFSVPGYVSSVAVKVSDRVKAGQELARLDTQDLDMAIRQAEIALEQVKLSLQTLKDPPDEDDLRLAELSIQDAAQSLEVALISKEAAEAQGAQNIRIAQEIKDKTEEAYENYQDVLEKYHLPAAYGAGMNAAYMEAEGNVGIAQVKAEYQIQQAQSQWLMAYNAYRQAMQTLDKLEQGPDEDQIRQLELQIEQAQLSLAQTRESLADAIIQAPFDGVVATVNVKANTIAVTGLPAITLLDDAAFFVDVTVDEVDIARVAEGQAVNVTLDAYPDVNLEGTVERIALVPTNLGGIIAYPLRVRLSPSTSVRILEGMTANVTISTNRLENVLLIPNWAVRTDQSSGETYIYCYCVRDGVPLRTDIVVGEYNESYTQVLTGLEEGTVVALVTEERNLLEFSGPPSR